MMQTKNKKQPITKDDNRHCDFLHNRIDTYHHLTSSNEPAIVEINQDQKHTQSTISLCFEKLGSMPKMVSRTLPIGNQKSLINKICCQTMEKFETSSLQH